MCSMILRCSVDIKVLSFSRKETDCDSIMMSQQSNQKKKKKLPYKAQQNGRNYYSVAVSYTVASREFVRQIPNTTAQLLL